MVPASYRAGVLLLRLPAGVLAEVTLEKKTCPDCGLSLPLKQFAAYMGKRHTLCRTCMAIDTLEFKEWVLPYVQKRREEGEAPYYYEGWEIAVKERMELTPKAKATMLCRSTVSAQHKHSYKNELTPEQVRPWKFINS